MLVAFRYKEFIRTSLLLSRKQNILDYCLAWCIFPASTCLIHPLCNRCVTAVRRSCCGTGRQQCNSPTTEAVAERFWNYCGPRVVFIQLAQFPSVVSVSEAFVFGFWLNSRWWLKDSNCENTTVPVLYVDKALRRPLAPPQSSLIIARYLR
ncbi:hypothetical protein OS493_029829 [Desmophyllum pertusum]|uniref:Uncharacterized protein n=1 Tax=Desmophyllum pertusum TaxID=174260 RepID=A0A9X0CKM4_9CNID|nr:hypothetical protein OS493_029829 [Desmophyllum pertusum]